MISNKRRRGRSSDKLLRLLPDVKVTKVQKSAGAVVAFRQAGWQQSEPTSQRPAPAATVYHKAVDLGRMTKTAIAYYTASQPTTVMSDRMAARANQKTQTLKCTYCGKDLDEEGNLYCAGKCGKLCHPSCGCEVEQKNSGVKWFCLKCAGVPRP